MKKLDQTELKHYSTTTRGSETFEMIKKIGPKKSPTSNFKTRNRSINNSRSKSYDSDKTPYGIDDLEIKDFIG